jgi:hypothetical protein
MGTTTCYLKSCEKCHGDLIVSGEELHCFQCGKYYYPKPAVTNQVDLFSGLESVLAPVADLQTQKRVRRSKWGGLEVNGGIQAKERREHRWWSQNRQVVSYLKEGLPVSQIATLTGRNPRQVRQIREQAQDLDLELVRC